MRATTREMSFIVENGTFVGVSLGYDYCAEHEVGIKHIKEAFGVGTDPDVVGADAIRVTKTPEAGLRKIDNPQGKGFAYTRPLWDREVREVHFGELNFYDNDLACAWNEESLALLARDPVGLRRLDEIFDALRDKDAFVCLSGSRNPFAGSGLMILIASRVSQKILDKWRRDDLERIAIRDAWVLAAGDLEEVLKTAGCHWYSMGTTLHRGDDGVVRTWLNPRRQRENNCGWFTVEELRQWANGEGPIPMKGGPNG